MANKKQALRSGSPADGPGRVGEAEHVPGVGDGRDEAALVRAAVSGDADAFSVLYGRYRSPLLNRCARILASREDVEDIAQEAFVRAYLNLDRFDCTKPFWPWLATIGERLALNHVRKARSAPEVSLHDEVDQVAAGITDPTFAEVARRDANAWIRQAIDSLPESQRRPLLASAVEG